MIDYLSIAQNEVVADLGAGTGYFCQQFLTHTAAAKIYAIDLEPNIRIYLQRRFADVPNLTCTACTPTSPCLPDDVDLLFMANTYRFITERSTFLANLKQQLPEKARVVIVDFKGNHARVTPKMAMEEVIAAGFEIYHYERDSCPDHYLLSFRLAP
ncbi:class I SAM-dependent methyltransferase [Celerinatantimonas diazotrophica]|uniref:class I SAM-dependent methyltransferase n=1 Tax=Celerinatantimonas diazotrophica TaxID=412034 RepID=UPI001049713C|nr:methyltransferase domain-containing protein [Celerinatantimonas diazotrophica]